MTAQKTKKREKLRSVQTAAVGIKQKQHEVIVNSMRKKTDNNRQTPMYSHVKSKVDTGGSKLRGP